MKFSFKLLALALLFALLFVAQPTFADESDEIEVSDGSDSLKSETQEPSSDEYEEEVVEEAEAEPQQYVMPASDVATTVKFLGIEDNKFVAGDEVVALIGMTNAGDKTYNVSYIGAHLHSPYDQNFYVQNFTVRWTSNLLPPKSEVTLEYRFRPDAKLDALDYHLSGWLIYNDSASTPIIYRSLFVNQTIEVVEARGEWTVGSVVSYGVVAAVLGLIAHVVLQQTGARRGGKRRATAGASGAAPAAAWDTKVYKPAAVSKSVGSKKHVKPTSNKA